VSLFDTRKDEERLTSLLGGRGVAWGSAKNGRVDPVCDSDVDPCENDMDMDAAAEAGREPSEGVDVPDAGGRADRRLTHDGRDRSGS
jgi:hypothetical protein